MYHNLVALKPVDGSITAAEWQGIHTIDESINKFNPSVGWLQNSNNWPFTMNGPDSPNKSDYPNYMSTFSVNPTGIHAIRVLENTYNRQLELSGCQIDCNCTTEGSNMQFLK